MLAEPREDRKNKNNETLTMFILEHKNCLHEISWYCKLHIDMRTPTVGNYGITSSVEVSNSISLTCMPKIFIFFKTVCLFTCLAGDF